MGRTRLPITAACLSLALTAACGGTAPAHPSTAGSPAPSASPSPAAPADAATPAAAPAEQAVSPAWKRAPGGDLEGSSALVDVAAAGPRDVWAVGYKESAEDREGTPALQHWNGRRWAQTAVDPADAWHLVGVSAAGPRDVWIVGNGEHPYAARWDGARWSGHRPFGVAEGHHLGGVAAGAGRTWFAGSSPTRGMVLTWKNGAFDNVFQADGYFSAIAAGPGHVWAVGADAGPAETAPGNPMIWHGAAVSGEEIQSWTRARTPEIPGGTLRRVWMISPSDVWAVGSVSPPGGGPKRPLVMHGDGDRWRQVRVPVAGGTLDGVTATAADDVWITGVDAAHPGQVLFLHFDGRAWTTSYGPVFRRETEDQQYPDGHHVHRTSVTRVPGSTSLWTVGSVGVGDDEQEFVLRRH
ncbi:hypothetical protein [Sphaerisporangium sp. TRM90804]|uniref:hypothetical protein n=1 Tax=Sphaerisporangium sp. TRM90804 TaxID=3031113 RepID=UPI00244C2BB4|nr:hypothetical protein [Sphaerisporangium sp. TRM90804]MDH2429098.1 hypothetical protein [Sphaerisporangium sp. TRM90804]